MSLEFLNHTPQSAYRKLEQDLRLLNPKIDLDAYKRMTPKKLRESINRLKGECKQIVENSVYGSWLYDDGYNQKALLGEALEFMLEYKRGREESEVLVPGYVYYRAVKQFGNIIEGERCYFVEDRNPFWMSFRLPAAIAKAFEVMRHGTEDDFKTIYVEMADGRPDAIDNVTLEHLTESTKEALADIDKYCDQRWEGPWPWETPAPYTLRNRIEETREKRMKTIAEMQGRIDKLIRQLNEGEMERFDMLTVANDMMKTVDNMISDIGKLSSTGIEAVANARTSVGDDVASSLEQALNEPLNQAADALTQLKASVQNAVNHITSGVEGGADSMDNLGGLPDVGSPMDAMGGAPMGGGGMAPPVGQDLAGDLADVSLDGEEGERAKKEV